MADLMSYIAILASQTVVVIDYYYLPSFAEINSRSRELSTVAFFELRYLFRTPLLER